MTLRISAFAPPDRDGVVALWRASFPAYADDPAAQLDRALATASSAVFVAHDDAGLAGTAMAGSDGIRGWPRSHAIGTDVLAFHGAPHWEDFYLLDEAPAGDPRIRPLAEIEHDLGAVRARVMVCGHSHTQRVVGLSDGSVVVNDGSVGLPAYDEPLRDTQVFVQAGSPHARYAMIEVTPARVSVELVMVDYDWRAAIAKAAAEGFESWARWLSGRSRG